LPYYYQAVVWAYLLYFFYILCLVAGAIVLTLSFMHKAHNPQPRMRLYLIFVISFFLLMLFLTINFFFQLSASDLGKAVTTIFTALFMIDLTFMVYFVPFFASWIVGKSWGKGVSTFFGLLALVYFALTILFVFFFPDNIFLYAALVVIFAAMIIFVMALVIRRRSRIQSATGKAFWSAFVILSTVFCPIIVSDAFIAFNNRAMEGVGPFGSIIFPVYYLWFNVLAMVYLISYFLSLPRHAESGIHKEVLEQYKITGREQEILSLLLEGLSYNEIAEKLCISVHTVNNHVANMYGKTGAKNKIELLKVLSEAPGTKAVRKKNTLFQGFFGSID